MCRYLHNFEDFYRKLGCTMVNTPKNWKGRTVSSRSLIRERAVRKRGQDTDSDAKEDTDGDKTNDDEEKKPKLVPFSR